MRARVHTSAPAKRQAVTAVAPTVARKKPHRVAKKARITKQQRKKVAARLREQQDAYLSFTEVTPMSFVINVSVPGGPPPSFQEELDVYCPRCRFALSEEQVVAGFEDSVLAYTTQCPECKHRFETSFAFEHEESGAQARFVWLCPQQTRDQYALWYGDRKKQLEGMDANEEMDTLIVDRPEVAFNAFKYGDQAVEEVRLRIYQFLNPE
jgi:hypothetical protein